jgi:hypothetical protein
VKLRLGAAIGLVCAALAMPAMAAGPTIVASPNPVHRGTLVRVHGVVPTCPHGDQVTLLSRAFKHTHEFAGVPAVFARVGAGAAYSVSTRIPATRRLGRYTITGRCGGGNLGVSRTLRVIR